MNSPTAWEWPNASVAGPSTDSGLAKSAYDYWQALRRRWWLVLLVTVLLGGAGTLVTFHQKPVYWASSQILIEPPKVPVSNLDDDRLGRAATASFFFTRVEILSSRRIAERVFQALELANWDELRGLKDPVGELSGWITVEPVKSSNLVNVGLDGHDPELVAKIVNTTVDEFIRYEHESLQELDQLSRSRIDSELRGLQGQLGSTGQRLREFHKTHESFLVTGESIEVTRLDVLGEAKIKAELELDRAKRLLAQFAALRQSDYPWISVEAQKKVAEIREQLQLIDEQIAAKKEQYSPERFESDGNVRLLHERRAQLEEDMKAFSEHDAEQHLRRLQHEVEFAERNLTHYEELLGKQRQIVLAQQEDDSQLKSLSSEHERLQELQNFIAREKLEVEIHQGLVTPRIQVIDRAEIPELPIRPIKALQIPLCLVGGLFLGCMFVVGLEAIDRRVRVPEQLTAITDWPVLGTVPRLPRRQMRTFMGKARLASEAPGTPACEAFRNLRSGLIGREGQDPLRLLLVTSAKAGEGKSMAAVNLAATCARAGEAVALIDVDLRNPSLRRLLGLSARAEGLTDVLLGGVSWEKALHETAIPNLAVLAAGPTQGIAPDILGTVEMYDLLVELSEKFDRVILDAPPLLGLADARVVGRFVDGLLLVVEATKHTPLPLQRVQRLIEQEGLRTVGIVFNRSCESQDDLANYGRGTTVRPAAPPVQVPRTASNRAAA